MLDRSPYTRWLGSVVGRYRLDQLIGQSELGPLFVGRDDAANASFLVRILAVPGAATADALNLYETQLQRFATQVTALQHPYILPLVDYGLHQGVPYLVWPQLVMRSLAARLSQSGPMDVVAVGRYLDQIAAALEAAHQQGTLHRNLSTENIFIQLDGHLVVADFGVRRLTELLGGGDRSYPFYGSVEACAPEQLSASSRADTSTDVYALGGVTFALLTGHPVFAADSIEALLQQHLYAQPPSLGTWRRGLPPELDSALAAALAKDQQQRFRHPGELANAYHQVVAPNSMTRVPFTWSPRLSTATAGQSVLPSPTSMVPSGPVQRGFASSGPARGALSEALTGPSQPGIRALPARPRIRRLLTDGVFVSVVLSLLLASSGLFVLLRNQIGGGSGTGSPKPTGSIAFLDSPHGQPGHSDALHISVHGLAAPPSGSEYIAWFISQRSEQVTRIGTLTPQGQAYTLDDAGDSADGRPGTNLLSVGDKIEITLERGAVQAPVGRAVMTAAFPPQSFVHIQHLLLSYPSTPGKIGLLVGVFAQTQLLDAQATALQNASANGNGAAVQCGAQSIVDIIEGAKGPHYRPLSPDCAGLNITLAGDGFGLLSPPAAAGQAANSDSGGYLDEASDHASLAATAPDATATIRLHASHVEVAITNIKGWVTSADHDALLLLTTPGDSTTEADLVSVCDRAYHGVPGNPDQPINPVPGQAGAVTAYEHGQFMATLTLVPTS